MRMRMVGRRRTAAATGNGNKVMSKPNAAAPTNTLMGNPAAPIKLIEFGALSCSHCAEFAKESFGKLTDPAYAAEFFTGVEAVAAGEQTRAGVLAEFWSRCIRTDNEPEKAGETQSRKPVMLHPLEEA